MELKKTGIRYSNRSKHSEKLQLWIHSKHCCTAGIPPCGCPLTSSVELGYPFTVCILPPRSPVLGVLGTRVENSWEAGVSRDQLVLILRKVLELHNTRREPCSPHLGTLGACPASSLASFSPPLHFCLPPAHVAGLPSSGSTGHLSPEATCKSMSQYDPNTALQSQQHQVGRRGRGHWAGPILL